MKDGLVLLCVGIVVLMIEGAIARFVPVRFVPDLGLLLVVAFALSVRNPATGVLLSATLGFVTDVFSGALLGQHALLRIVMFCAARFSSDRLNLRGPFPVVLFAGVLAVFQSAALWVLTAFFAAPPTVGIVHPADVLPYSVITGIMAPLVTGGISMVLGRIGDDDGGGRFMEISSQRYSP